MRLKTFAGIALVVLLTAAGCNNSPTTVDTSSGAPRQVPASTELVAMSQPYVPDLPVPVGFKIDEKKSRDYALAGARFVDHVYKGSGPKLAVKRFYEKQMGFNRWVLSTAMFVRGEVMLDFEKENERCRIIIADGSWFNPVYIKVQLWTSGPLPQRGQN